jgi:2,3-bisphosphoglycerate-dependent phosphoglycerate mutase
MTVDIIFETHSTTTDNENGIATGWFEGELSARGKEQAHELGERRRDDDVTAVFSSDLRRALDTAAIAFDGSGIPVLKDWRLRECDYGSLNGMTTSRLDDERVRRVDEPYPGGESYRQVVERMRAFLDGRLGQHEGGRVLLIGHSATRWSLDHLLLGAPLEELVGAPFDWQEGWTYTFSPS